MNNSQKKFLIFSGYNQRAVISLCRELVRNEFDFYIIASSKKDGIFHSKYSSHIKAVRINKDLVLDEIIRIVKELQQINNNESFVIAPVSEYLNHFFLEKRTEFQKNKCEIPLVSKEIYNLITNKYTFSQLCSKNGIMVPQKLSEITQRDFPVVAKPRVNIKENNKSLYPYIINSLENYSAFMRNEIITDFYFEKYVEGESYYLLFYFAKDNNVIIASQKNILQQADGKSIILAFPSDIHLLPASKKIIDLFKMVGFYGLMMLEVRLSNNDFCVIEANPRLWGPSQLLSDNSIPILINFINDSLYVKEKNKSTKLSKKKKNYFWLNGILEMIVKRKKVVKLDKSISLLAAIGSNLFNDVYFRFDTIKLFFYEIAGTMKGYFKHGF